MYINIVLLTLLSLNVFAQDETLTNEPRIWSGIIVSKDISDHFSLKVKTSFHTSFPSYMGRFNDVGFKYKLDKNWSISGFYRFNSILNPEDKRIYLESSYTAPFKSNYFSLKGRLRWQQKINGKGDEFLYTLRPRLKLIIHPPQLPFSYYCSGELFQRVGESEFFRYRMTTGIRVKFTEYIGVRLFFRHQKELKQEENIGNNTFNLNYIFSF